VAAINGDPKGKQHWKGFTIISAGNLERSRSQVIKARTPCSKHSAAI
jgi:hypothetical protein